jgi:hypothetical protein
VKSEQIIDRETLGSHEYSDGQPRLAVVEASAVNTPFWIVGITAVEASQTSTKGRWLLGFLGRVVDC